MAIEIKMPALSPTMEEGTLAKWLVKVGDTIKSGDLIAEIETDKATMEFEAVDEGTIASIIVEEGADGVKVGTVLAVLAEAGETVDAPATKPTETAPAATPVHEPEVTSSQQAIAAAPVVRESVEAAAPAAATSADLSIKASPLARRIAAARQLDLRSITGSGQGGRIMKADLLPSQQPRVEAIPMTAIAQAIVHAPPADVPFEAVKLSGMRKTIARRLTDSKQTVPHFYLSDDIRLDALLKLRVELNAGLESAGVKLSVNDLLIKALAIALMDQPAANVQFAGDELYQFQRVDVSIAVAIDGGLITPVVRDASSKRLSAIATEVQALAARARQGKLKPEEYQGGTVSLSNLGMYGIKEMVPVINPPQALILGVGAGAKRPFVINDELTVATVMTVTGSFDHRAIDGAVAAQFMAAFKAVIEQPMLILC